MSNFVIKTNKKSVFATARMPYGAYNALKQLALDHNGKIGETAEGFFKADFDSAKTAKEIKTHFDASYAEAHAAYVSKSEREPKKDTTKKSKPSSSKKTTKQGKGNAKLTGKDWVKAHPSCTREEAAAHGLKGITKLELKALKVELGVR